MKQASMLLVMALCWITFNLNAQTQTDDYFIGEWNILIEGAPGGGAIPGIMNIQRKDGKLEGSIIDTHTKEEFKIFKVMENENQIKLYFNTDDHGEIEYSLEKVDGNNLRGTGMGFLFIKGKRVSK